MAKTPAANATAKPARAKRQSSRPRPSRPAAPVAATGPAIDGAHPTRDTVTMSRAELQSLINDSVAKAIKAMPTPPPQAFGRGPNLRKQPIVRREGMPVPPKKDPRTNRPHVPGQPSVAARAQTPDGPLMVRATQVIYYELLKRRIGAQFALSTAEDFDPNSMVWINPLADEQHVTTREHLSIEHDEALKQHAGRARSGQPLAKSSARDEDDEVL